MSYCFESCATGIPEVPQGQVTNILDAVNPQRTLTMTQVSWKNGFKCMEQKGGLFADNGGWYGISINPNLGSTETNKTMAILLKHDQTFGDTVAREIYQEKSFILNSNPFPSARIEVFNGGSLQCRKTYANVF